MMLFLAGAVLVPLWAAMSLCAMPCCHQAPASIADDAGTPCGTDCAIRELDARTPETVAPPAPAATVSVIATVAVDAPAITAAPEPVPYATPPPDRALHLVNSVFLI